MSLPFELKHFKKISSDEKTTTLQHPKGHKIVIAHSAIDPKTRKKLHELPEHFAEGGMSSTGGEEQSGTPKIPGVSININATPNATPMAQPQQAAPPAPAPSPAPMPMPTPAPQAAPPEAPPLPSPTIDQVNPMLHLPFEGANAATTGIPTQPPQAPSIGQGGSLNPNQETKQAPQGAPALSSDFGQGALGGSLNAGINQEKAGIYNEAKAQGALGKEQAQIQHDAASEFEAKRKTLDGNLEMLQKERDGFLNDMKNNHIDPNHYMNSMGTGQKVSTAIGLILGGIGGGLLHQENPALKMLNLAIDRDIDAQRLNMDKNKNLLAANMQQFGNLKDAMMMTKIMQTDIVAAKLNEAAAKATDPIAKAAAQKAAGALTVQTAPMLNQIAMNQTLMRSAQATSTGDQYGDFINKLRVVNPEKAQEISKRYVPGMGIGSVEIPDASRSELVMRKELDEKFNRLLEFSKKNSGALNPEVTRQGAAMARDLQDAVRQANGQGVFKESEAHFMNSIVSDDPTALFAKYRVQPGYKQAKIDNLSTLNAKKKAYGLPVSQGKVAKPGWEK